jgi:hypothetical protein
MVSHSGRKILREDVLAQGAGEKCIMRNFIIYLLYFSYGLFNDAVSSSEYMISE